MPNLGEIGSRTKKLQAKNKTRGGKHPLPPVLIGLRHNCGRLGGGHRQSSLERHFEHNTKMLEREDNKTH